MTIHCSATPCPIILNAACVHYEGASLIYSGIQTNDTLEAALVKLDVLIKNDSATGIMTDHELTYDHTLIATALQIETDPVFTNWLTATPPAYISDIPTNVSDLTNDSGYITSGDIPTIPSDISELTDTTNIIPTATSDLTNDSGFITAGDIPAETDPDFNSWLSTTPPAYPGDIPSIAGLLDETTHDVLDHTGVTGIYKRIISTKSSNHTAGADINTDYVFFVTGTTTITLPTAIGNTNRYTIKSISGTTIVDCFEDETIDSTTTIEIQNEDSVDLISDNIEWKIV